MLIIRKFIFVLLTCLLARDGFANTGGHNIKETQCVCMAGNKCDNDLLALLSDKLMGWQLYPYSATGINDLANTALRMADLFVKDDPEKVTALSILKCLINPAQKSGAFRKNARLTNENFSDFILPIIYKRPAFLFRNLKLLELEEHTLIHLRKHIMQEVDNMPGDTERKRQLIDLLQQMKSWMDIKFSRHKKHEVEPGYNHHRTFRAKDRYRQTSEDRSDQLQTPTDRIDARQVRRRNSSFEGGHLSESISQKCSPKSNFVNAQDRAFKTPSPTNTAVSTPSNNSQSSRRSCFSNKSARIYSYEEVPFQNNDYLAKPSPNLKKSQSSRKIIPVEMQEFTNLQEH